MGINVFGGISEAKYSEGGNYVKPGVYRFKILACKHLRTRTGKDAFVVELEVLESTNNEHMPGTTCSWMVTLDKEPALGNIKQFITTVTGAKDDQVTEQVVEAIVSEGNPLKGKIARCSAVIIKTKMNRDFTKVKWLEDSLGSAGAAAAHTANGAPSTGA